MPHFFCSGDWFLLAQEGGSGLAPLNLVFPFIIIFVLFYMMILRPEKKKQADHKKMLSEMKKNDYVVTAGGIFGHVMSVSPDTDEVQIRVDENNNTRIKVRRSSISQIITDKDSTEKS